MLSMIARHHRKRSHRSRAMATVMIMDIVMVVTGKKGMQQRMDTIVVSMAFRWIFYVGKNLPFFPLSESISSSFVISIIFIFFRSIIVDEMVYSAWNKSTASSGSTSASSKAPTAAANLLAGKGNGAGKSVGAEATTTSTGTKSNTTNEPMILGVPPLIRFVHDE